MALYEIYLSTEAEMLHDITPQIMQCIEKSGVISGSCIIFCPHTTAGITINENADADVKTDFLLGMREAFPDRAEFAHMEGNSAAHLKASCVGASQTILIDSGKPMLGIWQAVYFCEFDGPRDRKVYISIS